MIWTNLLVHFGDWLKRNRATAIKWALILAAILIGTALIWYGVEKFHAWQTQAKIEALDKRIEQKDAEIKAAENFINSLKVELAAKDALLDELANQYNVAKVAHGKARTEYIYVKDEYEKTRDNPLPVANVTCADLRTELADLGIIRR